LSITTTRLPSGLRVVTETAPELHSVSIGFWVGTGSRDEPAGLAGASHFLEHLLFKGTETRTARAIAEDIDAVGGEMNAFTTKEYTAFYVRVLSDSVELALDILGDIMFCPAFRPDEVEAERQVILEEILMRGDEPADLAHELCFAALFPGHPLGVDPLGDEESVSAMEGEEIRAFFEERYRPANMVVAAAGPFDAAQMLEAVTRRVDEGSGAHVQERRPPGDNVQSTTVLRRPTEQAHLVVGTRALDCHAPDRYALALVEQALGGGMSSRLFQEIRETRGLAYSVYSFRAAFSDSGALGLYAGTAPDRAGEVLEVVAHELAEIREQGLRPRELEVARGHVRGSILLGLEDSAARMSRIGRSELVHGEVPAIDEVLARIDAVSLDDAARVTAEVLGNPRVLAVVGPCDEGDLAVT
jgi:predicted Zn-dependent peptidase